jgi:F-type H+-transporting ATPase subunit c
VKQLLKLAFACVGLVLISASTAAAQGPPNTSAPSALIEFSGAFGAGLVVIGAAAGIGRLAAAALESMARQPEVAGSIQTAMIIAAALIEGFTFYALYICSQGV